MILLENTLYIVIESLELQEHFSCEHACLDHLVGAMEKERKLANKILDLIYDCTGQEEYQDLDSDGEECIIHQDIDAAKARHELLKRPTLQQQLDKIRPAVECFDQAVQSYNGKGQSPTKRTVGLHGRIGYDVKRLRKELSTGGTAEAKRKEVERFTLTRFLEARQKGIAIHDITIAQWVAYIARDINSPLVGSQSWITRFKSTYGIVSCKVNKVLSRANVKNSAEIYAAASKFAEDNKQVFKQDRLDYIWNTDQIGFQLEYTSERTLDIRGTDVIQVVAHSISATTHSYTVMPVITASGHLLPKVLVCLQEKGGHIPVTLRESFEALVHDKYPNISITASESGKMTSSHVSYFSKTCLVPFIQPLRQIDLFLDSWSGHTNEASYSQTMANNSGKSLQLHIIPPGTTSIAQPLDVHFNYFAKYIVKRVTEKIKVEIPSYSLHTRNNIVNLISLTFHQLAAPRYKDMIRYAWFASGYSIERPAQFDTPATFMFKQPLGLCSEDNCIEPGFMRCAHCEGVYCLSHFIDYHYHSDFDSNIPFHAYSNDHFTIFID